MQYTSHALRGCSLASLVCAPVPWLPCFVFVSGCYLLWRCLAKVLSLSLYHLLPEPVPEGLGLHGDISGSGHKWVPGSRVRTQPSCDRLMSGDCTGAFPCAWERSAQLLS